MQSGISSLFDAAQSVKGDIRSDVARRLYQQVVRSMSGSFLPRKTVLPSDDQGMAVVNGPPPPPSPGPVQANLTGPSGSFVARTTAAADEYSRRLPQPLEMGARCDHVAFWKRLRGKKGFVYHECRFCGLRWRHASKSSIAAAAKAQEHGDFVNSKDIHPDPSEVLQSYDVNENDDSEKLSSEEPSRYLSGTDSTNSSSSNSNSTTPPTPPNPVDMTGALGRHFCVPLAFALGLPQRTATVNATATTWVIQPHRFPRRPPKCGPRRADPPSPLTSTLVTSAQLGSNPTVSCTPGMMMMMVMVNPTSSLRLCPVPPPPYITPCVQTVPFLPLFAVPPVLMALHPPSLPPVPTCHCSAC